MLLLLLLLLLLLDVRGIPCVSWGSTRKVSAIFEMRFPFPRQAQVTESAPQARLKFIDCTLLREIFDLELGVL